MILMIQNQYFCVIVETKFFRNSIYQSIIELDFTLTLLMSECNDPNKANPLNFGESQQSPISLRRGVPFTSILTKNSTIDNIL